MKQIYKLAQRAFEKRSEEAKGSLDKVYHMGHTDGYLDGFREAREMAIVALPVHPHLRTVMFNLGEREESPCGAV